jgi:hypothetical protein
MGLVSVVLFCSLAAGGEPDYTQCAVVESPDRYESVDECGDRNNDVLRSPKVVFQARQQLFELYGHEGRMQYVTYCVDENNLRDFYGAIGVTDVDDLPYNI